MFVVRMKIEVVHDDMSDVEETLESFLIHDTSGEVRKFDTVGLAEQYVRENVLLKKEDGGTDES